MMGGVACREREGRWRGSVVELSTAGRGVR
jgi:hypothetical protein